MTGSQETKACRGRPRQPTAMRKSDRSCYRPAWYLSLAVTLLAASCSRPSPTASPPATSPQGERGTGPSGGASLRKVGLLVTGPVSDGGWNEIAWKGCQLIQRQ